MSALQIAAGLLIGLTALLAGGFAYFWYRDIAGRRPAAWIAARLGVGKSVSELARRLGMPAEELKTFQPSYREAYIAKRDGRRRRILAPDAATKRLQRRILRRLLARLRAHPDCRGFERGWSIVHNALPHQGQAVVLRLDIVDFFATTRAERIEGYFRRIGWDAEAAALLTRLTTHEGALPQGAPTSPRISNLVNYGLDVRFARLAARRGGRYTRYADDLTFSLAVDRPKRVRGLAQQVKRILRQHGYVLHGRKKWSVRRRRQRQVVTGLVVNEKVQLPRERRRWLRAVKHRFETGRRPTVSPEQLHGWMALDAMVRAQASDVSSGPERR